jgi:cytochrome c oxidase assembly protein subunit 15
VRLAGHALLGAVGLQLVLGISTLLLVVPVWLAALHQAGAIVLFSASVWFAREATAGEGT